MNKLILLLLLFIIASELSGQDDPIFTDRPNVTDAVTLIVPGTLQVEMGYYQTKAKGIYEITNSTAPNFSFKYGLLKWLELRMLISYEIQKKSGMGNPESRIKGLSPVVFSPKFSLFKQSGAFPEITLASSLTFPSNGGPQTVQELNYGFRLLLQYAFEKFSWANSIGTDWPDAIDQTWYYTTVGSYSATDKLGVFLELFGSFDNEDFGIHTDLGFTYLLSNSLQIDAIYAININGINSWSLGFGLAWKTNFRRD